MSRCLFTQTKVCALAFSSVFFWRCGLSALDGRIIIC